MKKLYFIGGTMGVGKTTICQELKKSLPNSVFLDGDWCWDAHPFVVTEETKEMVIDNICHLLNNFLSCSSYDHVIFCWVMDQQEIIDKITSVIDIKNYELICISLLADIDTIQKRLSMDVEKGCRNEDVITRSIEKLPRYAHLNSIKIDTSDKSVHEVVDEVIQLSNYQK